MFYTLQNKNVLGTSPEKIRRSPRLHPFKIIELSNLSSEKYSGSIFNTNVLQTHIISITESHYSCLGSVWRIWISFSWSSATLAWSTRRLYLCMPMPLNFRGMVEYQSNKPLFVQKIQRRLVTLNDLDLRIDGSIDKASEYAFSAAAHCFIANKASPLHM